MKKFGFIFIVVLCAASIVFAQESKEDRRDARKARKAEQQRIALENTERLEKIAATKMFVLEAHTLFGKSGMTYNLNSTTNFVGFDGKNSTIQLAFNNLVGWNGVGGVTLDGSITKMEIKTKEGKPGFTINANVLNKAGGLVTMVFRVSADGSARVDMSGSFGDRLSFQGYLVALSESRVYKGVPNF